jgi:hypothetical protein
MEHENATLPAIRRRMELVSGLIIGPETASEHFQVIRGNLINIEKF